MGDQSPHFGPQLPSPLLVALYDIGDAVILYLSPHLAPIEQIAAWVTKVIIFNAVVPIVKIYTDLQSTLAV